MRMRCSFAQSPGRAVKAAAIRLDQMGSPLRIAHVRRRADRITVVHLQPAVAAGVSGLKTRLDPGAPAQRGRGPASTRRPGLKRPGELACPGSHA